MNIYLKWHRLKIKQCAKPWAPRFHEREIWWCSVGYNVGSEVYGKSELYNRPVLIVKKYSLNYFFGIPLSTSLKEHDYYHRFIFRHKEQVALVSQAHTFDARRLNNKLGRLPEEEFKLIKQKFVNLLD